VYYDLNEPHVCQGKLIRKNKKKVFFGKLNCGDLTQATATQARKLGTVFSIDVSGNNYSFS